jgi:hypothetical protein
LERNRIFDLGCRCYGVFPRGAVDIREPPGHRSADDFIVHPNLGLNSRPPKIAWPGEIDTAVTRLQRRDLQGRFIEATWTRAARQQKSDKQKGQRPDFRPHYAPVSILESAQLQIDGKQRTAGNCLAVSSPHELSLGVHALIAQRLSLHAICATAREQIALNRHERVKAERRFDDLWPRWSPRQELRTGAKAHGRLIVRRGNPFRSWSAQKRSCNSCRPTQLR